MYRKKRSLSRSDWSRRTNGKYPGKTQKKGMIIRVNPNTNLLGDGMVSLQDLDKQISYILKNNILFIPNSFYIPYLTEKMDLPDLFFDIGPEVSRMVFDEDKLVEWCSKNFDPPAGLDKRYWSIVPTLNYINFYIVPVPSWGNIRGLITYSNDAMLYDSLDLLTLDMTQMNHGGAVEYYCQLCASGNNSLVYNEIQSDPVYGFAVTVQSVNGIKPAFNPLSRGTFGRVDLVSSDINSTGKDGSLIFDLASGDSYNGIALELGMYFNILYIRPQ